MTTTPEDFIQRWSAAGGTERANYSLFLVELTELLGLPRPEPANADTANNAYVFERRVTFAHGDGSNSNGFIDLYRRGAFVCEAKQTGEKLGSGQWDSAMQRARGQAEGYARALPASEGRPPFLIVTDVGRSIELYSEFSRSGATYVPYPDVRSHRIKLEDLRRDDIRERLTKVWLDPLALDPTRQSARVTREIAKQLAELAKSLEAAQHNSEVVAAFLMRCLFTMFAEDVGLLPADSFKNLLLECESNPPAFVPLISSLWSEMNTGAAFSAAIRARVPRFNGGLFSDSHVLPLDKTQIALLREAARADWRFVEPAIFGTLLERALDPEERHALGAHYTPRAYVERLVLPTVIEPLREDWRNTQAAAALLDAQGKHKEAVATLREFHFKLCSVSVLDPACGSGNFLYVTLEHMKRLEGEVLDTLAEFGEKQILVEMQGVSVDPHQFRGLELNPRAARIAEAVLWIGYLQWHYRTFGNVNPPEPVLRDFHNIECRDAVLAYDRMEWVLDDSGKPVTRWDGKTMKVHPVTGEQVPDDSARVPLERYINPRRAEWPKADYVVGNPPFIGKQNIRPALGDGYVEALRAAYREIPESADLVMYWWQKAAQLTCENSVRRFGFITTNSLTQIFNRRVLEAQLAAGIILVFAVPDHPWVDAADGAAVRISMTVGAKGIDSGCVATVITEETDGGEGLNVTLTEQRGVIHADLRIGANVAAASGLMSNGRISNTGFILGNRGFVLTVAERDAFPEGARKLIEPLRNGEDIVGKSREVLVIDTFGYGEADLLHQHPFVWQWLRDRVYPERQQNRDPRVKERWWLFRRSNEQVREAKKGLSKIIVTPETSKHRPFVFISSAVKPEHSLVVIALDDAAELGILSSRMHVVWAINTGGTLEDRPRYNKTRCFETFPFPDLSNHPELANHIRDLAEQIDAHRKRQQALHAGLTLTGMYNVMERLRLLDAGLDTTPLNAKEKLIHEQGLVSVLRELHDALDAAVLDAYGWSDLAPALVGQPGGTTPLPDKPAAQAAAEEELLTRLVALNAQRAREEAAGQVRWLRPEFQAPQADAAPTVQGELDTGDQPAPAVVAGKIPWPKALPDQVQALRHALSVSQAPESVEAVAARFKGAQRARVSEVLETLAALGQVRRMDAGYVLAG